jgi:phosphoglycerate dehydrogenase-like enzyme
MKLLIYKPAYDRIKDRLKDLTSDIEPLLLYPDSTLSLNGESVSIEDANFDIAWASTDTYRGGPVRALFKLLRSDNSMKWFQSSAAGFDHQVFAQIAAGGAIMTRSDALGISIAEFVFARVFEAFQPNVKRRDAQAEKRWDSYWFRDVCTTTWLVVGMGSIGSEVALRAKAFGAHVIGVRRSPKGDEPADEMITLSNIKDAVPRADVVVLSVPANAETQHLVDRDFLSNMKEESVLVNIGRGALVDEAALLESLECGIPRTAILDVFETEPLPEESPFWAHPQVLITPHCAGDSQMTILRNDDLFLENMHRYLTGKELRLVVEDFLQAAD